MPNPGKFQGKRKAFLTKKRTLFDALVDNDRVPDTLLQIYRAYFKRFPMSMPEDEEPTDDTLARVDDNAAEPEYDTSVLDALSGEAYEAACDKMKEESNALDAKKGQIKWWFYYRYMRNHAHDPRSTDPSNPYNAVIMQLSGNSREKRPRCKAPVNIWCKEPDSVKAIQAEWDAIVTTIDPKKRAAKRAELASVLFKALPEETQKHYADRAKEEHEIAMQKWTQAGMGSISTAPADRQRCISALPQFVQPWLDALAHATGFKFVLNAGGPEPIRGGRLNVISMYSGTTNGPVPLTFGQAERDGFLESLLPKFGRYLKACYTPEECKSRALVASDLQSSLESVAMDEGAAFHSFGLHTTNTEHTERPEGTSAAASTNPNTSDSAGSNTSGDTSPTARVSEVSSTLPAAPTDPLPDAEKTPSTVAVLLDEVNKSLAEVIANSEHSSPALSMVPTPIISALPSRLASPRLGSSTLDQLNVDSHAGTPPPASESLGGSKRARRDSSPTSSSKRARTSTTPPDTIAPPSAPGWVKDATLMLAGGEYPGRWQELVAAWLVYEGRNNFADKGRLPPKGRPKVVAEWIKWARKASFTPKPLPNLTLIQREHNAWWASIQPTWRQKHDGTTASGAEGLDWGPLNVFGVNGMLSALASLYFWGMSLTHSHTDTSAWEDAVNDCLSVIRQLPGPL